MTQNHTRSAIATLLFLSGLAYAGLSPVRSEPHVGVLPEAALIAVVVLLPVLALAVGRFESSRTTAVVGICLSLLVCYHVVSNPYYPLSQWSTALVVRQFVPLLAVFWFPVLWGAVLPESRRRWLNRLFEAHVVATIGVAVVVLLIGLHVFPVPSDLYLDSRAQIPYRISTYPIQTHTIFMIYIVPAAVYVLGRVVNGDRRAMTIGAAGLLFAVALLSQIRKVYLALLTAIVAYFLFETRYREATVRRLMIGSPLLVVALAYAHFLGPRSTSQRLESWITQIPFALRHPLGTGHRGFNALHADVVGGHNIFIRAFSDYGVVALVLLVVALGYTVLRATRVCPRTSDVTTMSLGATVLGLIVGLQFESPYFLHRFWFLVALFHIHVDRHYVEGGVATRAVSDQSRPAGQSGD